MDALGDVRKDTLCGMSKLSNWGVFERSSFVFFLCENLSKRIILDSREI